MPPKGSKQPSSKTPAPAPEALKEQRRQAPSSTKPQPSKSEATKANKPKSGQKPLSGDKRKDKKNEKKNALIVSKPKTFGIGQSIRKRVPVNRFVKWPKYVRIQRQRAILLRRLKVPPAINQFSKTLDKSATSKLMAILSKYKPETKHEKKQRLLAEAESQAGGDKKAGTQKKKRSPVQLKYGINNITCLVEQKKAQLVVIAHDIAPIELVLWLPALCHKMQVPYCIVTGKARLGTLVHLKTSCALALTSVRAEDKNEFGKLVDICKAHFNEKYDEHRRQWGGGMLGNKAQAKQRKKAERLEREGVRRAL